jgi:hypothetical protein
MAPSAASAATAQRYYVGHGEGRTQCLYVGPSWDSHLGARTIDFASFNSHGGHNLEWAGPAGAGWQSGHSLVVGNDRAGRPVMRAAQRTSTQVTGTSTVIFKYHRDGHATVTSAALHPVSWMSYAKSGCPTD